MSNDQCPRLNKGGGSEWASSLVIRAWSFTGHWSLVIGHSFRISRMTSGTLKHPGRWLWLLLLVPAIIGLTRLRFDVEVFDLLPDDLPAVKGLKIYQQYFANARDLIITVTEADAEE